LASPTLNLNEMLNLKSSEIK